MSYDYVLALVEECHRFEEKAYTRVSLEELVGNRKLIDEYAALLFRTVNRFGRRSGSRALNALGMELVEASLRLLMLRYLPSVRTCRKAMRGSGRPTYDRRRSGRSRAVETAVLSFCAGTAAFTAPLTAAFEPTRAKRRSEAFRCVLAFLRKEIRFACRIGFIQPCIGEWYEFRYRALIQAL